MSDSFFDEVTEQSEIKTLLVSKYFWAWAKVMISAQKRYRPKADRADMLIDKFAGRTLTMEEIYEQHHVDTPYISSNYKDALNVLEDRGLIICDPPAESRPMRKGKRTFADHVRVTFPSKA